MNRQENPSSFRLTRQQIESINQQSIETGMPKNRIVRLALDQYFRASA
jgi:predicted DNA-binding protein